MDSPNKAEQKDSAKVYLPRTYCFIDLSVRMGKTIPSFRAITLPA